MGDVESAVKLYDDALKVNPKDWRAARNKAKSELNRGNIATASESLHKAIAPLNGFIFTIRQKFKEDSDIFFKMMENEHHRRNEFLSPQSNLDHVRSILMILRKWNSYTPAIPSVNDERNPGGGYFIWHNGHGTVIDPGYNFIENYFNAGCRICDIDNIVITHAHNDHTNDFEALRALLFEYNAEAAKYGIQKKVSIYMNNGAYKK
jgi:tetratricopeptide (TPR) repeat protein